MSTPEISKLNWSRIKPKYEEVKGKTLVVEYNSVAYNNVGYDAQNIIIAKNAGVMECYFDENFIRYAIIDTEPELIPLWGVMPEINIDRGRLYAQYIFSVGERNFISLSTLSYKTESECIEAWNLMAEALEPLKEKLIGHE